MVLSALLLEIFISHDLEEINLAIFVRWQVPLESNRTDILRISRSASVMRPFLFNLEQLLRWHEPMQERILDWRLEAK